MHHMTTVGAALSVCAAALSDSSATVTIAPGTSIGATVRIDLTHTTFGSSNDTKNNIHTLSGTQDLTMTPSGPPWAFMTTEAVNLHMGAANYNFEFFCFPFIGCQNLNVALTSVDITTLTPVGSALSGTGHYAHASTPVNLHAVYSTSGIDTGSYTLDQPAEVNITGRLTQANGVAKVDQFSLGSLIFDVPAASLPPDVSAIRLTITPNTSSVVFTGPWAAMQSTDFDGDGLVNGLDLGILLSGWGTAGGDVNNDGMTDGADLGLLLGTWTG